MAGKRKSPSKSKRKGKLPQEVTTRRLRQSQTNTAQDFVREEFVINGAVYQPIQHGSVVDEELMPGSTSNKMLRSSAVATKKVDTAQPAQGEEVDTKPVHTEFAAENPVMLLQPPVKVDDYAMAPPPRQECDAPRCQYITPEGIPTWDLLIRCMGFHTQAVHQTKPVLQ